MRSQVFCRALYNQHDGELPPFDLARLLTSTLTDLRYLIFKLMLEESSALTSTTPAAAVTGDHSDDEVKIISDSSSPSLLSHQQLYGDVIRELKRRVDEYEALSVRSVKRILHDTMICVHKRPSTNILSQYSLQTVRALPRAGNLHDST